MQAHTAKAINNIKSKNMLFYLKGNKLDFQQQIYKILNFLYKRDTTYTEKLKAFYKKRNTLLENKLTVIDVGAAICLMPHWEKLKHFANIYAIEPDERSSNQLLHRYKKFPNYKVIQKALSESNSKKILNLTKNKTGSSLLEVNKNFLYRGNLANAIIEEQLEIDTFSLDYIIENDIREIPSAIKLDVQGYEYLIISSLSPNNINQILCFELEAGFHDGYINEHNYTDIDIYLRKNDYELYDLRVARGNLPDYRLKKDLSKYNILKNSPKISAKFQELDAVYFKKIDTILGYNDKEIVIKMIYLLCTYNFFYEATYLAEQANEKSIITTNQTNELTDFIWNWYYFLEDEVLYTDRKYSNLIRNFMNKFQLKNSSNWHRYMWQNYPC